MVLWLCALALAGTKVIDFDDVSVEGELVMPSGEWVFQRELDAPMGADEARKLVRRFGRRGPSTPIEKMRYGDALQVMRYQQFRVLAQQLDQGESVDFTPLDRFDRTSRDLYLDAAPGLADDHAARALFLAAQLASNLGLNPVPELETSLELDPTGAYASHARLMLAESAFTRANLIQAIQGYTQVVNNGGRHADYATYKRSWCHYNVGDVAQAIDGMVVLSGKGDGLAREARRDAVLFASELETPEAFGVVDQVCAGDGECVEASQMRLREHWKAAGR